MFPFEETDHGGTTIALWWREPMEVRDGFIIGVFNYCDRWCERCAFTSRCRLFADVAEMEASLDPELKAVADAPPRPEDVPPAPPQWLQELLQEMNEAASEAAAEDPGPPREATLSEEHTIIELRARHYCLEVFAWLRAREGLNAAEDSLAVIRWFHMLIAAKVHRALYGLAEDDSRDREWPADYDGSAKVALLGIEESHAAWLSVVERGIATDAESARFIGDLVWLGEALERVFPNARAFVRPGLDEPGEVSMMLAKENRP